MQIGALDWQSLITNLVLGCLIRVRNHVAAVFRVGVRRARQGAWMFCLDNIACFSDKLGRREAPRQKSDKKYRGGVWRRILGKTDEISSTQKLLDLIRSKDAHPSVAPSAAGSTSKRKPAGVSGRLRATKRGAVTVAVDIGPGDVKLAAASLGPDRKARLINWAAVPMAPEIVNDPERLSIFLPSVVADFCEGLAQPSLWGFISSANVEIRFLKVPKVPARQLTNAVVYAFRKESIFNEKTDVFDYRVIGESEEDAVPRLRVMASVAPRQDIDALQRIFARNGCRLAGLSVVPCALQNLFRAGWLETEGQDACALFIGRDWSRIAIFSQGQLVLSRDIKAGMQSMVEAIHQDLGTVGRPLYAESGGTDGPVDLDEDTLRQLQQELNSAWQTLTQFIDDPAVPSQQGSPELPQETVFHLIRPALDRIVRQVELTLKHYQRNFTGGRVGCLFISGQVCHQPVVEGYFSQQLGLDTQRMDPFERADTDPACPPPPTDLRTRNDFAPVVGLTLARHFTTSNFLHTYQEKAKAKTNRRLDAAVWAVFAVLMLVCLGAYGWLGHQNRGKVRIIEDLQQQLSGYSPRLDENLIADLARQTTRQVRRIENISQRYRGVATVHEIERLTPQKIRLISLSVENGTPQSAVKDKEDNKAPHLVVDGIVRGERSTFDPVLADYMMAMANSPVMGAPVIENKTMESLAGQEVLRFVLRVPLK